MTTELTDAERATLQRIEAAPAAGRVPRRRPRTPVAEGQQPLPDGRSGLPTPRRRCDRRHAGRAAVSDGPRIEIEPGYVYWAPPPPNRVRSRWERVRLWWWQKRGSKGWVPLGATTVLPDPPTDDDWTDL